MYKCFANGVILSRGYHSSEDIRSVWTPYANGVFGFVLDCALIIQPLTESVKSSFGHGRKKLSASNRTSSG